MSFGPFSIPRNFCSTCKFRSLPAALKLKDPTKIIAMKPTAFGCEEFQRNLAIDRRGFLKAGALGMTGFSLSQVLKAQNLAVPKDRPVPVLPFGNPIAELFS